MYQRLNCQLFLNFLGVLIKTFITGIRSATVKFFNEQCQKSVESNWLYFKDTLVKALDHFVPSKRVSGRYSLPWLTRTNKRLIRQKQKAYNRAKKSNKDSDWATFRRLRKKSQQSMKQAHWDYVNRILEEDGKNSKGLWRYLKGMRKDNAGVSPLSSNGKIVTTAQEKAEALNKQFSSVFTREDNSNIPEMGPSPYEKMPPIEVTEKGVKALLSGLNSRKATGPDDIPAILLKTCADDITPMLTFIIQKSINAAKVPLDWKKATVTPIYKKGNRAMPENYRPVSLTSICCKIAEHVIVSNVMKHLDKTNFLSDQQHGFRRKRSCESQLIITTNELAEILNRKGQVDMAILDFAKAFDKVPHNRLLKKLGHCNINKNVIGWIQSFLQNRTQRVAVDGCLSKEAPVLSGVPQGTVLGPALFLIFINDIGLGVTSKLRLFADDCLIFREIRSLADTVKLQEDLNRLVNWSKRWGMSFNVKKCNVMTITNKKKKILSSYGMEGSNLERVSEAAYLGITITSDLEWRKHVENITSSAERLLGFLWRTMHKCPRNLKSKAFTAIIRPKLDYAATVWDPHHTTQINKLERVQRRGARFVNNNRHCRAKGEQNASPTEMLSNLQWPPLQVRRQQARLVMLKKIIDGEIAISKSLLPPINERNSSRHPATFQTTQPTVDTYKFAFIPRTTREWNKLPKPVTDAVDAPSFKSRLGEHLQII